MRRAAWTRCLRLLVVASALLWGGCVEKRPEAAPAPSRTDRSATAARAAAGVPELDALRFGAPPLIDGHLDDPGWQAADETAPFVDTMTGAPAPFASRARIGWDATHLYVGVEVDDDFLQSTFTRHDAHLWEQDCVELMVDPDGDGRNYFELQVAPTGVTFDTRYDSRRQPQPFGHTDWESHLDAKVAVRGTPNDASADGGYTVEAAIPWAAFDAGPTPAQPPRPGDVWRMNLYVLDARPHGQGQRAAAWSPPLVGDFHVPSRFGRVRFIAPPPPSPRPPPPPAAADTR
ncbi:MAG: carbohydrate-binding family 9-like protein [Myxococcales bacterium]|nr:carbohydrate-binding family 9-like protein [Myxococcales bacterium]